MAFANTGKYPLSAFAFAVGVDLRDEHLVRLTSEDLMMLRVGLISYLREFARHRAEDGGATHPEDEWQALKLGVGQLLWKLEEVGKPPGARIGHSEDAVRPDDA